MLVRVDHALFAAINGLAGRFLPIDYPLRGFASDYLAPVIMSLLLLGLWFSLSPRWGQNKAAVMTAALALGLANLAVKVLNWSYFRNRPFDDVPVSLLFYRPTDSSFPSNAAAVGFSIAMAVMLHNRRASRIFFLMAFLFAFSRVYVGVHYPLDFLGGMTVGLASGYAAFVLLRWLEPWPSRLLSLAQKLYLA